MLRDGYYEVFGNIVEVEGDSAFDIDANEEIPIELVIADGTFIGEEI